MGWFFSSSFLLLAHHTCCCCCWCYSRLIFNFFLVWFALMCVCISIYKSFFWYSTLMMMMISNIFYLLIVKKNLLDFKLQFVVERKTKKNQVDIDKTFVVLLFSRKKWTMMNTKDDEKKVECFSTTVTTVYLCHTNIHLSSSSSLNQRSYCTIEKPLKWHMLSKHTITTTTLINKHNDFFSVTIFFNSCLCRWWWSIY